MSTDQRTTPQPTYRLVKGTVDELEKQLNRAVRHGYTELFREFPPPFDPSKPDVAPVYAFMMRKPAPPQSIFSSNTAGEFSNMMREAAIAMGFGDRLPPPPEKARVLDLVRPPTTAPAEEEPKRLEPEFEHPTP